MFTQVPPETDLLNLLELEDIVLNRMFLLVICDLLIYLLLSSLRYCKYFRTRL